VDLRFWKTDTIPTKVGVSLSLQQWKVLYSVIHPNPSDLREIGILPIYFSFLSLGISIKLFDLVFFRDLL
jgi:hypothetical protein